MTTLQKNPYKAADVMGNPDMARPEEFESGATSPDKNARRANPIDAHVGGRVRLRRMLLGMSQERLAEQLGLTFQQVQKYEKGINRIGASRLYELSRLLGVGVEFFYEDVAAIGNAAAGMAGFAEQGANGESYIVDFLNSREGLELNRAFMRITDSKVRKSVIDLVKSFANQQDAPGG